MLLLLLLSLVVVVVVDAAIGRRPPCGFYSNAILSVHIVV
jgi:hypothetical protein